jgi:hypothetical protein
VGFVWREWLCGRREEIVSASAIYFSQPDVSKKRGNGVQCRLIALLRCRSGVGGGWASSVLEATTKLSFACIIFPVEFTHTRRDAWCLCPSPPSMSLWVGCRGRYSISLRIAMGKATIPASPTSSRFVVESAGLQITIASASRHDRKQRGYAGAQNYLY